MRAARIHEDLTLRVDDIDDPTPGRGQVLVRVHAAGVCGTDLHILDGMIKPDPYPMTLGHEAAGIVEAVGEGVSLTPGTPGSRSTTRSSAAAASSAFAVERTSATTSPTSSGSTSTEATRTTPWCPSRTRCRSPTASTSRPPRC